MSTVGVGKCPSGARETGGGGQSQSSAGAVC